MPFVIVRNDIANMRVDAIVNTANPQPVIGPGADARIHEKAGPGLLEARQKLGPIGVGCAAATPAFDLQARYVIHTVGPVWEGGGRGEEALLQSCYENSLKLALELGCRSVAFPLISTGNYGFPKDRALQIAISAFSTFLTGHEMQVYLAVFDRDSFRLSEKLFRGVESYIDENYVAEYGFAPPRETPCKRSFFRTQRRREAEVCESSAVFEALQPCAPKAASLEGMLQQMDAGFTETLLKLIDETGRKDSEIYKKAGLTKQHFSKIRNNPNYRPTKPTAIALALALELDLEAVRDLIGRAGYALTNSSKFDLIIRYFIEQGKYDVVEINMALYEFDQPLLCS